jgi:hypothetical protein
MSEASSHSNDLTPGLTHWWASASHPVPPAAGSYVLVDGDPVLAATAPGPIVAVLVLPGGEDPAAAAIRVSGAGLAGMGSAGL